MILCPIRALRYYLDKTKDLRENKHLLFISFKDGFFKDIQRSTISSWLKQLLFWHMKVLTQTLSNVKAHDVRSMAASLAFKGGVSLNQILFGTSGFGTAYCTMLIKVPYVLLIEFNILCHISIIKLLIVLGYVISQPSPMLFLNLSTGASDADLSVVGLQIHNCYVYSFVVGIPGQHL